MIRCAPYIVVLCVLSWPADASAADLQSVYVAPGGVYIAGANVHVGPGNGYPAPYGAPGAAYYHDTPAAYVPRYVPPGALYRAPAYYEGHRSVYPVRPGYVDQSEYPYEEIVRPQPPAPVPYNGVGECNLDYGRLRYCD
jgi:hypothetical protein